MVSRVVEPGNGQDGFCRTRRRVDVSRIDRGRAGESMRCGHNVWAVPSFASIFGGTDGTKVDLMLLQQLVESFQSM
jgi:hypothetical protein